MFMELDKIYGPVEDETEQGLGKLLLNNYPYCQQKLETQLSSSKSNKQQKTYTKSHWHKFIERELQQLHKYDYDITFQRCSVSDLKNAKIYRKRTIVKYKCDCGQKWESSNQKVVFNFQLLSQKGFIEEILMKKKIKKGLTKKSAQFGSQLVKEMQNLINLAIHPYFLKYQLTIDGQQCSKCSKMTVAHLQKSKISVLSKLFCRQVCQILAKQCSIQQQSTKELSSINK